MATCTTTTASGSSTAVMEMRDLQAAPPHTKLEAQLPDEDYSSPRSDPGASSPPAPAPASVERLQRWNYPKSNVPKIGACFWSFIVMGANDAAYGVSFFSVYQTRGLA